MEYNATKAGRISLSPPLPLKFITHYTYLLQLNQYKYKRKYF